MDERAAGLEANADLPRRVMKLDEAGLPRFLLELGNVAVRAALDPPAAAREGEGSRAGIDAINGFVKCAGVGGGGRSGRSNGR